MQKQNRARRVGTRSVSRRRLDSRRAESNDRWTRDRCRSGARPPTVGALKNIDPLLLGSAKWLCKVDLQRRHRRTAAARLDVQFIDHATSLDIYDTLDNSTASAQMRWRRPRLVVPSFIESEYSRKFHRCSTDHCNSNSRKYTRRSQGYNFHRPAVAE
jgi:hypothetical protein